MDIHIPSFYVESDHKLNELCSLLQDNGICYFSYLHHYADGSQSYFSNSSQWTWDYYHLSLYKSSLFSLEPKRYKTGYYIWPHDSALAVFDHGVKLLNSGNGITYIDVHEQSTEFYFFSGLITDRWLINFYLNNLGFLSNFIRAFKKQAENLLAKANKHRIILPSPFQHDLAVGELAEIILSDFINKIHKKEDFEEKNDNAYYRSIKLKYRDLSAREFDIIMCLVRGESAKVTARSLNISSRTVEKHLENVKIKLNCKNKTEIIGKIIPLDNRP